jgi:ferritin
LINNLVNLAIEEKDHATNNFLQWFVSEQVEEEASVDEVVQKLKLIGDGQGGGLFLLDQELGQRTVTIPPEMTTFISAGA